MISVRKSGFRGHTQRGWLDSYHTFAFADYYDPQYMGFRTLRIVNEDRLSGGRGVDGHPHRDFEIITYVISGALAHKDSLGHVVSVKAGGIQCISAGTGIEHSEYNDSSTEIVHFLQLWLHPAHKGLPPTFAHTSFSNAPPSALTLACSAEGRAGSLRINQDADLFIGRLAPKQMVSHPLRDGRCAWVQLIAGDLNVNGHQLTAGDGVGLQNERDVPLATERGAHLLLADLR
jgi:redox-sensitive bicupin YhaK (pirin superfamily)